MVEEKKGGAVVVMDYGRMIGILTERDLLRAIAYRVHTSDARVREWMTEDPSRSAGDDARRGLPAHAREEFPAPPGGRGGRIVGVVSLHRAVAAMQSASA